MNYPNAPSYFPGKLQAVAIIQTVIGILEILGSIIGGIWVLMMGIVTMGIGLIALPIPFFFLIVGILSVVSGIKGLNKNPAYGLSMTVAIGQMLLLLSCDIFSFGCGCSKSGSLSSPSVSS